MRESCDYYLAIYKTPNGAAPTSWTGATGRRTKPPRRRSAGPFRRTGERHSTGLCPSGRSSSARGGALERSQELAEQLQLDASQRQAVFEELLAADREDEEKKALLSDTQRAAFTGKK